MRTSIYEKKLISLVKMIPLLTCIFLLVGCGTQTTPTEKTETEIQGGFVMTGPDAYDSSDTVILTKINSKDMTMTFYNMNVHKHYTLEYDGTTKLFTKSGSAITESMIGPGDVVDIKFMKGSKHLSGLSLSGETFIYEKTDNFLIDEQKKEIKVADSIYKYTSDTRFFSGADEITASEIKREDTLSITCKDTSVLSVKVESGHGYISLINDEYFIGGWIEIGRNIITEITPDMEITVPEGKYEVNISKRLSKGTKNVAVKNGENAVIDLSDIEIVEPETGKVLFTVEPEGAKLFIDGKSVDYSAPITLEYGLHKMSSVLKGYETQVKYLKVGQSYAEIIISLEPESTPEPTASPSPSSSPSPTPSPTPVVLPTLAPVF